MTDKIKAKADHVDLSAYRYITERVKRKIANQWPEDYYEVFGKWEGDPLQRFFNRKGIINVN